MDRYLIGQMPIAWHTREMRLLHLYGISVHGSLPQSWEEMPRLQSLKIDGIQGLSGTVPDVFRQSPPLTLVLLAAPLEGYSLPCAFILGFCERLLALDASD